MINDVDVMSSFAICISSDIRLLKYFVHIIVYFMIESWLFLKYILDTGPLSDMCFENVFS